MVKLQRLTKLGNAGIVFFLNFAIRSLKHPSALGTYQERWRDWPCETLATVWLLC